MDRPGHVAMQFKVWSTDVHWRPKQEEPQLEIFQVDEITKTQVIPEGRQDILDADFERKQCYEDIRLNMTKKINERFFTRDE